MATYEVTPHPATVPRSATLTIVGSQLFSAAVLDADRKDIYQVGVRVGNGHGDYHLGIVTVFVTNDWLEDADGDGLPEEDKEALHGTSDSVADSGGDGAWGPVRKVHAPDAAAVGLFGVRVGLDGGKKIRAINA